MIVIFTESALRHDPEMYGAYGVTGWDRKHSVEIFQQVEAMERRLA